MMDLQKAGVWKRFAAWLLDLILVTILAAGFGTVLSSAMKYDEKVARLEGMYAAYEQEYGVKFNITAEEYESLTPEQLEVYKQASDAVAADTQMSVIYNVIVHQSLIMVSVGILISVLVLEFVVPLVFGNGQTVGKKIFGIGLMRVDHVKVNTMQMFVRTLLGKYTIEIMFPFYVLFLSFLGVMGLAGTLVVAGLLLVEMILLVANKNHAQIHDLLAGTVAVDITCQKIFESAEAKTEYTKRIHADMVSKKGY